MIGGLVERLRGGVVVSVQAPNGGPLDDPAHIAAMAGSAELGGAAGFRVDGPANVEAVRAVTRLPIIGISKQRRPDHDVYITPTLASARMVVAAGADLVAVDGTDRPRPGGETAADLIGRLRSESGVAVMADVSTREEAERCVGYGADLVATTLAGYTAYSDRPAYAPALDLLAELVAAVDVPVVVEGGIWTPEHVAGSFAAGAYAVVVGSAVTSPELITRRLVRATAG